MSRTCNRCGKKAAKGMHYVTVKVGDTTMRMTLKACLPCGRLLTGGITKVLHDWTKGKSIAVNESLVPFTPAQLTLINE